MNKIWAEEKIVYRKVAHRGTVYRSRKARREWAAADEAGISA